MAKKAAKAELIAEPNVTEFSEAQIIEYVNAEDAAIRDSAAVVISRCRVVGDALSEMKKRVDHGAWLPWIDAHCSFDYRQAQQYMKVSDNWSVIKSRLSNAHPGAHLTLKGALALLKEPKPKKSKPQRPKDAPESEERYTPLDVVQAARFTLGEILLDPASTAKANEVVEATRFITREEDGLKVEWLGSVFLSPPAALPGEFIEKCVANLVGGQVKQAIVLTDALTWLPWWHRIANASAALCHVRGSLDFTHEDGSEFNQDVGQTIFYAGRNTTEFMSSFDKFGFILSWAS